MLVLTTGSEGDSENDVIIRDSLGRKLCEVTLLECRRGRKARWGFSAGSEIKINRRMVDRAAYPLDYFGPKQETT